MLSPDGVQRRHVVFFTTMSSRIFQVVYSRQSARSVPEFQAKLSAHGDERDAVVQQGIYGELVHNSWSTIEGP
jgi:hypothetical protein